MTVRRRRLRSVVTAGVVMCLVVLLKSPSVTVITMAKQVFLRADAAMEPASLVQRRSNLISQIHHHHHHHQPPHTSPPPLPQETDYASPNNVIQDWDTEELSALLEDFKPMPESVLHFFWCGPDRIFDFRNYVAVRSAIRALRPRGTIFHYTHLPVTDPEGYFTWFQLLFDQFPNFVLSEVSSKQLCVPGGFVQYSIVYDILKRYGGIYVPEDAIVLNIPQRVREMEFVSGIASKNLQFFSKGIALARKGALDVRMSEEEGVRKLAGGDNSTSLHPCSQDSQYGHSSQPHTPSCVRLTTHLFPRDVLRSRSKVATLVRLIVYGKTDLRPRHTHGASQRTPRVAHYLCDEHCTLSFEFYISILSAVYVAGMDHVILHGPTAPSGVWWERLQQRCHVVSFAQRKPSTTDSNRSPAANQIQRYITRTEILLQHGGVFHDSHVIWTRPLPEELRDYEAVASPDWQAYGMWPESVSHALLIARAGAEYLQQLLKLYRENLDADKPWYVDRFLSYRLLELDPPLLHLYPRLQVKCQDGSCHPVWQGDNRCPFHLNLPGHHFHWRQDVLSIHWSDHGSSRLEVDNVHGKVKVADGLLHEVLQHVLWVAGEEGVVIERQR